MRKTFTSRQNIRSNSSGPNIELFWPIWNHFWAQNWVEYSGLVLFGGWLCTHSTSAKNTYWNHNSQRRVTLLKWRPRPYPFQFSVTFAHIWSDISKLYTRGERYSAFWPIWQPLVNDSLLTVSPRNESYLQAFSLVHLLVKWLRIHLLQALFNAISSRISTNVEPNVCTFGFRFWDRTQKVPTWKYAGCQVVVYRRRSGSPINRSVDAFWSWGVSQIPWLPGPARPRSLSCEACPLRLLHLWPFLFI